MVFGHDAQTIYFYGLVIGGGLTVLYFLFGDILDGVFDVTPGHVLNPTVVLSFIAILCGMGLVLEIKTSLSTLTILVISTLVSLVLVSLIHFFILVPISKAEQSTGYSINDLIGKTGQVILSIPEEGMGEVNVKFNHSLSGYPAKSANKQNISSGVEVKIVNVQEGVLIVEPM